jgi:hypothetical protein
MKINKKKSLQQFLPLSEAEIQFFIQLKPILDIFLLGFSLSSCPQHSPLALIPFARKSHVSFKVCTQL